MSVWSYCILQEAATQLGEAYQSQLSIQQNELMKIFTVVTVVFLPLPLLADWYGMNFSGMSELHWKYGHPLVCLVGLAVVLG
ncbi:CorA family divalent cation transporter [Lachnospiraceae bacterium 45-W7]